jgi:hypothetical protein
MNRRVFIATTSAGVGALTGGCLDTILTDGTDDGTDGTTKRPQGPTHHLFVENHTDATLTGRVTVTDSTGAAGQNGSPTPDRSCCATTSPGAEGRQGAEEHGVVASGFERCRQAGRPPHVHVPDLGVVGDVLEVRIPGQHGRR